MWFWIFVGAMIAVAAGQARSSLHRAMWDDNPRGELRRFLTEQAKAYDLPAVIYLVKTDGDPCVLFVERICEGCHQPFDFERPTWTAHGYRNLCSCCVEDS